MKRAGTPCVKCGGQVMRQHRDEPAACVQCGFVPPGQREREREPYETQELMQAQGYKTRGERLT